MPAVLTGDLIKSTAAPARAVDFSLAALDHAAEEIAGWGLGATRFTRFRGDGWQVYLSADDQVLRAALFLAACLRAAETGLRTRIGGGVGAVERLDDDLGRAAGPAFIRSGRALDAMPRTRWLVIDGVDPDALGPRRWWNWPTGSRCAGRASRPRRWRWRWTRRRRRRPRSPSGWGSPGRRCRRGWRAPGSRRWAGRWRRSRAAA